MPATKRITTVEQLKEHIGQELRVSRWRTLTQHEVDVFGELSGENAWIHNDQERARDSTFGGTIAQGTLTLSMAPAMLAEAEGIEVDLDTRYGLNYGFDRVRFITPVVVGQRIRARLTLLDVKDISPGVIQITWRRTVEVEGAAKPAMVADALSRQYLSPADTAREEEGS
jgi:acyl dehydratase